MDATFSPSLVHCHENQCPGRSKPSLCHRFTSIDRQPSTVALPHSHCRPDPDPPTSHPRFYAEIIRELHPLLGFQIAWPFQALSIAADWNASPRNLGSHPKYRRARKFESTAPRTKCLKHRHVQFSLVFAAASGTRKL